jgi:Ca2+-binding RTX toxin-like protein
MLPAIHIRRSRKRRVGQTAARQGAPVRRAVYCVEKFERRVLLSGGSLFVSNGDAIYKYSASGAPQGSPLVSSFDGIGIAVAGSDIFVLTQSPDGVGTVGEYTTSGATVNRALITGLIGPTAIAASGSDLFVASTGPADSATNQFDEGAIGEYSTAGAIVNAALVSGLDGPVGIAVSGSELFVTSEGQFTCAIGAYMTSGAAVNAALVTGYSENPAGVVGLSNPSSIVVSGQNLFVENGDSNDAAIAEYTTAGAIVNPSVVQTSATALAVSGSDLFAVEATAGAGSIHEFTLSGAAVNTFASFSGSGGAVAMSGSNLFLINGNQIGQYTVSGATVNASLMTFPTFTNPGIAVSDSDLFTANSNNGTVSEFTTSGATVNSALISGLPHYITLSGRYTQTLPGGPLAIAVSGDDLFVTVLNNNGQSWIGEYTTSGATVNAKLVTGLQGAVTGIAVSGSDIFVVESGVAPNGIIGEFTTSGAVVNAALVPDLGTVGGSCGGLVVSGSDLFVAYGGKVSEYTTSGAAVNTSIVSEPVVFYGLAVLGSDVFVTYANTEPDGSGNFVGEYTTSGTVVNATLISTGFPLGLAAEAAGPASQLVFAQQPFTVASGAAFSPTVTVDVEDENGNIVTSDVSAVTIGTTSGGGSPLLTGTTSAQAINGVATFSDLAVNTPGTYTLTATDGSLTGAASSLFTIQASFATLTGGSLLVQGTGGNDVITLQTDGDGNLTATLNGVTSQSFPLTSINSIDVEAGAGNDYVSLGAGVPGSSVQGGPGDDTILGGAGNDTLGGGQGNDSVNGGPGDDSIKGGQGDDLLCGGKGNDTIFGSLGNDTLRGGLGDNSLDGGAGTNQLYGGLGNNVFYAVDGTADQIFAGAATNDSLFYSTTDNPIFESGTIPAGNQTLVS